MPFKFETLGEDILLRTLTMCDVYTVLLLSMVNKSLRRVTMAKQLWLSLLHDLAFRTVLDLPPSDDLQAYSTRELVNLIKNFVIGPIAWLPGISTRSTPHHQSVFDTGEDAGNLVVFNLLAGGRYMVLQTREGLHIYEVKSGRKIWKYVAPRATWSVDLLPGGTILHVIVAPGKRFGRPEYISVQEVNLLSGQSNEVFNLKLSTSLERWIPSILGDFVVFALQPYDTSRIVFLLVNWREESHVVLNYAGCSHYTGRALLIPGHIVVTYGDDSPSYQQLLTVTALASLAWKPLQGSRFDNEPPHIPFTVHETLEYEHKPLCDTTSSLKLVAFPSPLQRDTYEVVIYACEPAIEVPSVPKQTLATRVRHVMRRSPSPKPEPRAVLLSYWLSLPISPDQPCGWLLKSAVPATPGLSDERLSYAGYCLDTGEHWSDWDPAGRAIVDARRRRAGTVSAPRRVVLERESEWQQMCLSSSGAVMMQKGSSIIVSYYN